MKKISVIIPCYNAGEYIERCLKSMEEQTYIRKALGELELILVDDASTDDTYERLLKYEEKHQDNVIVIACGTNEGPANARNTALKHASGEYISFMDADDVADVTMFERMYEVMLHYDVDVVECAYMNFSGMEQLPVYAAGEDYDSNDRSDAGAADKLNKKNVFKMKDNDMLISINSAADRGRLILNSFKTSVWGRLYKRCFIEDNNLFFPENMTYGEDNFFSGLAMLTCGSYYRIGDRLYYYYNNENGIIRRTGDNDRIRQLADIMQLYICELDKRGFLGEEDLRGTEASISDQDGRQNEKASDQDGRQNEKASDQDGRRNSEVSGHDGRLNSEAISDYAAEFEWYMIYKYFMDPVSFVMSRKMENMKELIDQFGQELLDFFPEAYDNVYLNSDKRWKDYVTLLRQADKSENVK